METFDDVSALEDDSGVSLKAKGMLLKLKRFSTLFGLRLSHLVFSAGEELSQALQSEDCSIHAALVAAEMTC